MKKRIVLCADDYGQAQAISQAIVSLIKKGHLSAASCMVNTPEWPDHAQWLLPLQDKADLGLHFNLTEGRALSPGFQTVPLPILLRRAFSRRVDIQAVAAECHAQIDRFEAAMGRLPDYVDGHQHVHHFPGIRDALLAVCRKRLPQAYVRIVNPHILSGGAANAWKKLVIRLTGSGRLRSLLRQARIPHNASFAGIYAFDQASRYPEFFRQFLARITDRGLIMCHPGLPQAQDSIAAARHAEYQYLASEQFRVDCGTYEVEISRLPR